MKRLERKAQLSLDGRVAAVVGGIMRRLEDDIEGRQAPHIRPCGCHHHQDWTTTADPESVERWVPLSELQVVDDEIRPLDDERLAADVRRRRKDA